ncbi:DUF3098 domain-containing protein [Lewinella sp. W8]|uniref:DUF3098 domain-containing protein n=1 Tax=Lewinella sp. W8 TaxID=2528208 RepID=UPI0010672ED4|nr:DUF3098 domain-containing protein [Lewinella sp. W8]MTB52154.1 DUF3098 domain-containing protein [Lewinella sp. W8]
MSKRRNKAKKSKAAAPKAQLDNTRVAAPVARTTVKKSSSDGSKSSARPLTFGPETYKWMGGGFALVLLGILLMAGGRGDDPTVFDADAIYSFRRITLAPIVMLVGLAGVIYGILKK